MWLSHPWIYLGILCPFSNSSPMTRRELIEFCLTFPAAYEDYPFDNIVDAGAWTVMRHRTNIKSFALIYERNGELCVNLKCEPFEANFLRQAFKDVTPAYHMNKVHWNTVTLSGDVPDGELKRMIARSYDLIKPKIAKNGTVPEILYHFTCQYLLPSILKSGYLTLTESNFSFERPGLFPVVWLTDSPTPENIGLLFDANIPDVLNKTHIRFTIKRKPYMKSWDEWSASKGMDNWQKQALITSADAENTYKCWHVSEKIIPINEVLIIENMATKEILFQCSPEDVLVASEK